MRDDSGPDSVLARHREGLRHLDRYLETGDSAALMHAVALLRLVVDGMTAATPGRDLHFRNLAFAQVLAYELDGTPSLLEEAVGWYRHAVASAGEHGSYRHVHQYGLGRALRLRHKRTGDLQDLDEAVEWQRGALADAPVPASERPRQEAGLAETLMDRHHLTGDRQDLADCLDLYRSALHQTPEGHPDRIVRLNNLGAALAAWNELTGDAQASDESVARLRAARGTGTGPGPGSRSEAWRTDVGLAEHLVKEHARTERPEDIHEAVALYERALAALDPAALEWPWLLDRTCDALLVHGEQSRDLKYTDHALRLLHHGMATRPAAVAEVAWKARLGRAHRKRHTLTGDPEDLDQAVAFDRAAIDGFRGTPENLSVATRELAAALRDRHRVTGSPADLEEAIGLCRSLLAEPGTTGPAPIHVELARCLLARHQVGGDLTDLDPCIGLLRSALDAGPDSGIDRPALLGLCGDALMARFRHTGEATSLDEALESYRNGAAACQRGGARHVLLLASTARAVLQRYELAVDPADGDEAVGLFRHALAQLPGDRVNERIATFNLASALRSRYEHLGDPADLEESVELLHSLVGDYPQGHPDQVEPRAAQAEALYRLHLLTGDRRRLSAALDAARAAVAVGTAPVVARLRARVTLGQVSGAGHDWEAARCAFRDAVDLLPRLANRSLTRTDQQHALAKMPGLAAEAAAYALQAGKTEQALEVLEHGRGVLLARRLQVQGSDLDQLARADPRLAEEFLRLRDEDDDGPAPAFTAAVPDGAEVAASDADERQADRRRTREADWERLLGRIRALPGMSDFLRPSAAAQIVGQAGDGPIALINVSIRCDAVIVAAGGIDVVPLQVTSEEVHDKADAFLAAVDVSSREAFTLEQVRAAQETVSDVLEWLWDAIAEPVLRQLGVSAPERPSRRIWWCPQGVLAFLPLHAAGYHGDRADPDRPRSVPDVVVSSYTPTIGALHHARGRSPSSGVPRPLIVAMHETPGARPLPNAETEAAAVRTGLSSAASGATLLSGEEVTRERVLAALRGATSVHLICHAVADTHDPSASRVLTHDHREHPLTVADISELRLEDAGLAYLSACSTSRTRRELADEAIHITGAFQLAGYRHVVGTLWPVPDTLSPEITRGFYAELTARGHDPDAAAFALNAVLRETRDRFPLIPSLWSAHLHVGP